MDQAVAPVGTIDLQSLSDEQLGVLERKIATKYMRIVPWGAVAWAFGNLLVWLALWPLTFIGVIPLWLAFPIATLNVALSYLPSHEAQHSIIASRGHRLRWLNELVGHLSTIPMAAPFRVLRATHFEHHKHCNDPELDPDYGVHAPSGWEFLKKTILSWQPAAAKDNAYPATLKRLGKERMMIDSLIFQGVYMAGLFGCAWTGHAIEAALLWWLPQHLASVYIRHYLSWAPHTPAIETGRYRDTRGFRSALGNALSMGMQYHIVHHLYPRIPLSKTPAAYRELKPILERKGCDLGAL